MAELDLVIRGGTIADGRGGELFEADIAIEDNRIVAMGRGIGRAKDEIDARGLLVTPGFVDIHTHYDGQVVWDQQLAPSSFHGVTTVVMGNCGVGFAPVRPHDHDRLIELMEGVEDIPEAVLREGLSWAWESFGDYLDLLGSRSYDMDVAAQLPHAPLRVFVMGERACNLEAATEADIAEMRRLSAEAMRAGAIGFSTSRSLNHKSIAGDPTPSLTASEEELRGIALGMRDAGGGVFELASDFPEDTRRAEFAMLRRIAAEAGVPMSFAVVQKNSEPEAWREMLGLIEEAQAAGVRMMAQVAPRPVGGIVMIEGSLNPFKLSATYQQVMAEGATARTVRRVRESEIRAKVLEEVRPRLMESNIWIFGGLDRLFVQCGSIVYEPDASESIAARAAASGQDPLELFFDRLHEGAGDNFIYFPARNYARYNLDPVRQMLAHPHCLPGLGDGGAHVSLISDASFPTYLLANWAKSGRADGFDLGWLVKRQTQDTARYIGLTDRGVLAPGMKADINLIDMSRLGLDAPVLKRDLPAGGARLLQRSRGYVATIVSGQVVSCEGESTGVFPGRLVRGRAASRQ